MAGQPIRIEDKAGLMQIQDCRRRVDVMAEFELCRD